MICQSGVPYLDDVTKPHRYHFLEAYRLPPKVVYEWTVETRRFVLDPLLLRTGTNTARGLSWQWSGMAQPIVVLASARTTLRHTRGRSPSSWQPSPLFFNDMRIPQPCSCSGSRFMANLLPSLRGEFRARLGSHCNKRQ